MNMIKNKKAGMGIAIFFLVMATLVLVIFSLVTFNLRQEKQLERTITTPQDIEKAYADAELVGLYLDRINGVVGLDASVEKFDLELAKYKDDYGNYFVRELKQAEGKNFKIKFVNANEYYNFAFTKQY